MRKSIFCILVLLLSVNLKSQDIQTVTEAVDTIITWPWNWDIASDGDRLVTVNENGTLNIKVDGSWQIIQIDPDMPTLEPRGVIIDKDGIIWFTTTEHGLWTYSQNEELTNFNSTNSFLPIDNLRNLAIQDSVIWISTDNLGIIRHDFKTEETTYFTSDQYPDLKTNALLDPFIDPAGNVWFRNREFLTKISTDLEWTNEDMRFHISGGRVNDIHIVSETEIWLAMDGGVVLFDGVEFNIVLQDQFRNYKQVFKDSNGDIWLSGISVISGDGITILRDDQTYFFDQDDYPEIPNQVFELLEHRDTVIAVGTIGNSIVKLVFDAPTSTSNLTSNLLKVYPNPTSKKIYLLNESDDKINKWTLVDMFGKKVIEGHSIYQPIDISDIQDGTYILTFEMSGGIVSKKVTITNN